MKNIFILVLLLFIAFHSLSQDQPVQTIRGTVTDQTSGQPLSFVSILLTGTVSGTTTDGSGNFALVRIPVGRYTLQASMVGYESFVIRELQVTSGKEVFLDIPMKESITSLSEVVAKPRVSKNMPVNGNATVSARMLSVEEATRYAGGFDDPARLVTSFAGVTSNVGNNSIIVRGNNPQSLQWKLEGVEIPNPNHFADLSAFGGGGLTALSSQLLANSDFLTGAMPAEYNNALSGVFDIFMRSGNNRKTEKTFQIGPLGIDFAAEGPFRREGKSSYLFNYRYSTLGLLEPILPENAGGTNYQDLSFKLSFPVNKYNSLSVFGIGLIDRSGAEEKLNRAEWQYDSDRERMDARQFMSAAGITHKILLGHQRYIKSTLAATMNGITLTTGRLDDQMTLWPENDVRNRNATLVLSSFMNSRFSSAHTNKTGFTFTEMLFRMKTGQTPMLSAPLQNIVDEYGHTALISAYSHSMFNLSPRATAAVGLNLHWLTLNNPVSVEPRIGFKYEIRPGQSLNLAYGLHSRMERLNYYFVKDPADNKQNPELGLSKAHHLVLGYDLLPSPLTHLKAEVYFQYLFDIPVIADSSYSLINQQNDWFFDAKLRNSGKGRNAGIDITYEKYLSRGFYYLATASFFVSRYNGGDLIWRNTRFNRNYLLNFLAGKEWNTGKLRQNSFGLNLRMSFMGGECYTPVDPWLSAERKEAVQDESRAFTERTSPAFISHFTALYRINRKKMSHEIALKFINLTRYKDFQGFQYNYQTGKTEIKREEVFIPNLSWKIEF